MMNTASKFRTGRRSLNRGLCRHIGRYSTRMLGGARRPRVNELANAVKILNQYIRLAKRLAKKDPAHFDHATAQRNYLASLRQREMHLEIEAAIHHVYGS